MFPRDVNVFKKVPFFAAFTGLASLEHLHLHLAEVKLGLRKKFHIY